MGLAGACFRSGGGVLAYAKGDRQSKSSLEPYLPIPGQVEHEYMLALPIDHPEMTPQLAQSHGAHRCRQLIGVVTIGSTYRASGLQFKDSVSLLPVSRNTHFRAMPYKNCSTSARNCAMP
jgi:hypothetical protein